jgi:hypothetical protein
LTSHLRRIGNPRQLALVLNQIPGVVENGLFIDICDIVVIGHGDGRVHGARHQLGPGRDRCRSTVPPAATSSPIWATDLIPKEPKIPPGLSPGRVSA